MYRAIGLKAMRMGIDPADVRHVVPMLDGTNVSIEYIDGVQHVLLDGEDVSELIRTEEVSHYASVISTIPEVRKSLWNCSVRLQGFAMSLWTGAIYVPMFCPMQRKSFLLLPSRKFAARRYTEYEAAGKLNGRNFDDILCEIKRRDERDSTREAAPSRPADDASRYRHKRNEC